MLNLEAVPHHYEDAVALLANWHRDREDADFAAYSFPDPEGIVVRLLEISSHFPTTGTVRPVQFGRSSDFPFPSAVALLSPQDWASVLGGLVALPEGWSLESAQRVQVNDQE